MTRPFWISIFLLILAGAALSALDRRPDLRMVENRLNDLPMDIGGWKGEERRFEEAVYQELDADATLYRRYIKGDQAIFLYIGYYGTKKGGRAKHQPQYCYPGSGWDIESISREGRFNLIRVKRGDVGNVALYWNHSGNNRVLSDGIQMNLNRVRRRLLEGRDDGAFIRISGGYAVGGAEPVINSAKDFATNLLPLLPDFWPIELETQQS